MLAGKTEINDYIVDGYDDKDPEFQEQFTKHSYAAARQNLLYLKKLIGDEKERIVNAEKRIQEFQEAYNVIYNVLPDDQKLLVELDFGEEI